MPFESSFYTENGDIRIIRSEQIVVDEENGRPFIDFVETVNAQDGNPIVITEEFMKTVTTIITTALDGEELPIEPVINIQFEAEMNGRTPDFVLTQRETPPPSGD